MGAREKDGLQTSSIPGSKAGTHLVKARLVITLLNAFDEVQEVRVRAREPLAELNQTAGQRVGSLNGDGDGYVRVLVVECVCVCVCARARACA